VLSDIERCAIPSRRAAPRRIFRRMIEASDLWHSIDGKSFRSVRIGNTPTSFC
jgi:hypothetical protein